MHNSELGQVTQLHFLKKIFGLLLACCCPGWAALRSGLGQATYTCVPLVTKLYNLVPAKRRWWWWNCLF